MIDAETRDLERKMRAAGRDVRVIDGRAGERLWGILAPHGQRGFLLPFSVRRTRREAIRDYEALDGRSWAQCRRVGYRVVRLLVAVLN